MGNDKNTDKSLNDGIIRPTREERLEALRARVDARKRRREFFLDSISMSIKDEVLHPTDLIAIRNELNRLVIKAYDDNAMIQHCCLGAPEFEMNDEARALFNNVVHEDVIAVWDNPTHED